MDYQDHIAMAALEAVNEIWGYDQVTPEEMLEQMMATLEAEFWEAWKGAEEGSV